MCECVKKFLVNVDNPEEEEIESCILLASVGSMLDILKFVTVWMFISPE